MKLDPLFTYIVRTTHTHTQRRREGNTFSLADMSRRDTTQGRHGHRTRHCHHHSLIKRQIMYRVFFFWSVLHQPFSYCPPPEVYVLNFLFCLLFAFPSVQSHFIHVLFLSNVSCHLLCARSPASDSMRVCVSIFMYI